MAKRVVGIHYFKRDKRWVVTVFESSVQKTAWFKSKREAEKYYKKEKNK